MDTDFEHDDLLKRLIVWYADLRIAGSAIDFLKDCDETKTYNTEELRRFKCYETAFVVSYGRVFTKSNSKKFPKLTFDLIDVDLNETEKALHEKIIKMRDKIYAHSDKEFINVRLDIFELQNGAVTTSLPYIKSNEGVEFSSGLDHLKLSDLCEKIVWCLFYKIGKLVNIRRDKSSIHIQPTNVN